ncbi:hypothetical protein BJ875DRAFT_463933 [Amylocarpus encephaloides]|uniref:Uncharacterized protein n=1 Tax=Amylocarpus encephaloides TaxID=45428 RepID=A0A9P7YGU2_9HELO|nr:hypothetical protein BJ875DRAFT_463933 [Amylocarpus encephaloides]
MSRRGIFPLLMATTFGIINGVWVFGPALKEQREAKDVLSESETEVTPGQQQEAKKVLAAEATASRSAATATVLKPEAAASTSWWHSWSNHQEMKDGLSKNELISESQGGGKDEKR